MKTTLAACGLFLAAATLARALAPSGPYPPTFYSWPADVTTYEGGAATFTAYVMANPTPTYQWRKDGVEIPGATWQTLTLTNVQYDDAGSYAVVATNTKGSALSWAAGLMVLAPVATITRQPASTEAFRGGSATLQVGATGPSLTYQWRKDGTAIPGATGTTFTVANATAADMGFYAVTVSARGNPVESDVAILTVATGQGYRVTTLAGGSTVPTANLDGTGTAARFLGPSHVAVDTNGVIYVADYNSRRIRKISAGGVVTTLAGGASGDGSIDGPASTARFSYPSGVAVDRNGNVFVADLGANQIRKITPDGTVTTLAGAGSGGSEDGPGNTARFGFPADVAVDASGNVFVADRNNATIRKVTPGGLVSTFAGLAGQVGVVDGTGSAARFNFPNGVAVDASGNVYVADSNNHTIRKITPGGAVSTLAGAAGGSGSADGVGAAARFNNPFSVAVDGSGNVYVADSYNHTIRRITAAGVVTTIAGTPGQGGNVDGPGTAARFAYPQGVAVDGNGTVFVGDYQNNTVRQVVPPAGSVPVAASRLVNISTRAFVPADGNLTLGFVLGGSGAKQLLVRGVGPTLARLGVDGFLADPKLEIMPAGTTVPSLANDDWGTNTSLAALVNTAVAVGAFALDGGSKDAALLASLDTAKNSGYAVRVAPAKTAGAGIVLADVYDADPPAAPTTLANVSALGFVGTGLNALVPGFVIGGTEPKRLLIRAVGPGLAALGVGGFLADPQLALIPLGKDFTVARNDNWGGTAALAAMFTQAGAFALAPDSRDAALVVTLPPGGYTVQVTGAGDTTGTVLVEIYDLDP